MSKNNGSTDGIGGTGPAAGRIGEFPEPGEDYMTPSITIEDENAEEVEIEEESIDNVDPVAFDMAHQQRIRESRQSVDELKKRQDELINMQRGIENKVKDTNLEDIFQKAEVSTYAGVEKALNGEVQARVKKIQSEKIEMQRKAIDKEGIMRLVMAALYKTKIVAKPTLNLNPEVDTYEIVNSVLSEFAGYATKRVSQLGDAVESCSTKFEETDSKVETYEDLITETIVHYENLQEQMLNTSQELDKLKKAKRGLQKQKGQNPLDAEITGALNQVVKDYKDEQRKLKQFDKMKEELERNMRQLHDNFAYAKNNKEIYKGLMTLGKDKYASAEIHLNRLQQLLQSQQENKTIRSLLSSITDVMGLEKTMSDTYGPFYDALNNVFKHVNDAGAKFKSGQGLLDIISIPAIEEHNRKEGVKNAEVYDKLKAIVDI